ncbi:hypothetical protein KCP73_04245 [Salmonella enterica subsp. enterica]|nr:hypothetical protein KCP73_04245 [Salmonella enterica subsp. enterica]
MTDNLNKTLLGCTISIPRDATYSAGVTSVCYALVIWSASGRDIGA